VWIMWPVLAGRVPVLLYETVPPPCEVACCSEEIIISSKSYPPEFPEGLLDCLDVDPDVQGSIIGAQMLGNIRSAAIYQGTLHKQ